MRPVWVAQSEFQLNLGSMVFKRGEVWYYIVRRVSKRRGNLE